MRRVRISISEVDARQLLALLQTSDQCPDVVEAIEGELEVLNAKRMSAQEAK